MTARFLALEARLAQLEAKLLEQAQLILAPARKLQDRDLPRSGTPNGTTPTTPSPAQNPTDRPRGR